MSRHYRCRATPQVTVIVHGSYGAAAGILLGTAGIGHCHQEKTVQWDNAAGGYATYKASWRWLWERVVSATVVHQRTEPPSNIAIRRYCYDWLVCLACVYVAGYSAISGEYIVVGLFLITPRWSFNIRH